MTLFLVIVALEMYPMVTLMRWRRHVARGEPVHTEAAAPIARISVIQTLLGVAMIFAATAMARGMGEWARG
jgi:putative membrane protein